MCKNHLQEYTQKLGLQLPIFSTINEGFQHVPRFRSSVLVNGTTYASRLTYPRQKAAEQNAAKFALDCLYEKLNNENHPTTLRDLRHCKSILIEFAVKMKMDAPKYKTIQRGELRPTYISRVSFCGKIYIGEVGKSKKEAEQLAACIAIKALLGSDSGVLCQIINSKSKMHNALRMVKVPSFKQSIVQKSVESSERRVEVTVTHPSLSPFFEMTIHSRIRIETT